MSRPAATVHFVRGLFLRLLALVALVAFVSLWIQIEALIGHHGILPAGDYLAWAGERLGPQAIWRLPTLLWISSGDLALHLICGTGTVAALLALLGFFQLPAFLLLWVLYLSLTVVGQDFLSFQWDVLLLESLLLACLLAPARPRARLSDRTPSPVVGIWLVRLLVFKLMFLSGATKLASGDPTWWNLTALDFHYFTQPLPTWTSWWAQQLPDWVQRISTALMFVVELGLPWLIFVGRRSRLVAFVGLSLLQVAIAATGNFGFFNLLSLVLCVTLLDDGHFVAVLPVLAERRLGPASREDLLRLLRRGLGPTVRAIAAVAIVTVSTLAFVQEIARSLPGDLGGPLGGWRDGVERRILAPTRPLLRTLAPFRSINGYGLFRAMTTRRPEVVIEASRGGGAWHELPFRWKPGDPLRRPRFVAPYHPRLDWQMWFVALDPEGAHWVGSLALRLLEDEATVWRLLDPAARGEEPPDRLRLRLYDYRFTTREERKENGAWWRRELRGDLSGVLTADGLRRSIR